MHSRYLTSSAIALIGACLACGEAVAAIRITEFLSEGQGDSLQGNGGRRQREYFELTNLGSSAVDVSGWSWNDDNPNDPHLFGAPYTDGAYGPAILSIAPGESVIFTQMTAAAFRELWGLPASVQVYSYLQRSNLGNADTINIYNSATPSPDTLVDSLSYTSLPDASFRGSGISRSRPFDGGTGQFPNSEWVLSFVGDAYGSYLSPNPPTFPGFEQFSYAEIGNPGTYAIPEPSSLAALAFGLLLIRRPVR